MTPEEIWRAKSDEEVLAAVQRLDEFTDVGKSVILNELSRRQLGRSDLLTAAEDSIALPVFTSYSPMVRLWRGEFSLPVTFWVYGFLGSFVWAVLIVFVASATHSADIVSAFNLAQAGYYVIVVVGIWRSSARYKGNPIWGDLARVAIALAILKAVATRFLLT
jgi:hypothetical protein